MKHRHLLSAAAAVLALLLLSFPAGAQNPKQADHSVYKPFAHLDAGITLGSSGIGFDLASPMGPHLDLRLGFTFVPPVGFVREYDLLRLTSDEEPTQEAIDRMDKMCGLLQDLTNTKVNRFLELDHRVFMYNAKLMLDWYPFRQRNVHFTVGAFVGSSYVGFAQTTAREGATLTGINMYNGLYEQCLGLEEFEYPCISLGDQSIELDPTVGQEVKDRILSYGRMQLPLGTFVHDITDAEGNIIYHEGDPHYVTPTDEGIIRLEMRTHVVKPYLGFGYNAYLGPEQRWNIGFDLGMVVLGQSPHVYSHDGVCLTHDVTGVGGLPGKYVRIVQAFPVYPLLEFKTAYRIK